MTQPIETTQPTESALPDVYVLSVDYRDGTTSIVRVSTDLDDLFNHYGPDSFTPALPWETIQPSDRHGQPVNLWHTRFATGNNGAHLWIRRMPLHGTPATDTVRCPGCGHSTCPHPRLECGGESFEPSTTDINALADLLPLGYTDRDPHQDVHDAARAILTSNWFITRLAAERQPHADSRDERLRDRILSLIPLNDPELIDAGYTILASDVLDRLNDDTHTGQRANPARATQDDVDACCDDFYADLAHISDADLLTLMNNHPNVLALAREHGWQDSEVRDQFAAALEANGYTLD